MAEKKENKKIREELFYHRKNGFDLIDMDDRMAMEDYCEEYKKFLNNARTLVAKHDRELHSVPVEHLDGQVGVANTACNEPDEDLIGTGRINGDIAQNGRLSRLF